MARISAGLWVALAGAVLQVMALGSNYYVFQGGTRDAWQGIPHTSDLMLASALVTVALVSLTAGRRSPLRGRAVGLVIGIVGLLATAQLVYRMVIPPFGCLQYGCGVAEAKDVTLLTGIWVGLAGNVLTTVGGFLHAFSAAARATEARPWRSDRQPGINPWLGLAALGAVGMFVFPFTAFTFYTVSGFLGQRGTTTWGGWLSVPHTSSLVLAMAIGIVGLVLLAARKRAPMNPSALGAVVAVLAFTAGARILYRILAPPFSTAGGQANVQTGEVQIGLAAFLGLGCAVLALVAGIAQAVTHRHAVAQERREGRVESSAPGTA